VPIAVVHETPAQDITGEAPFDVVRLIVRMVEEGLSSPERPVRIRHGRCGSLPAAMTTPLAVVLTELLQNAVEHAFPVGERDAPGDVLVELGRDGATAQLRVVDDGVGVAPGFSLHESGGLGLTIVRTFIENDLGGKKHIGPRPDGHGTDVTLRVPVPSPLP
jgi:two-component sensor histidine kinase